MKTTRKLIIFIFTFLALAASAYAADTLHGAVRFGLKADVQAMIAKGADVNARDDDGRTPLYALGEIVIGGHPFPDQIDPKGIAALLIAKGAEVNAKDKFGNTPLHVVDDKGVIELLLAKGANVNARNNKGATPLHAARNLEAAKWLLAKGADVNAMDNEGETPLFNAILLRKDLVPLLLAHGADVNAKNKSGQTPLDRAAIFGTKEMREMMAKQALKQKPNPRELLAQAIVQLKNQPGDDSTRQHVMKLAQEIKPAPAIPEEAEKFEGRAQYAFRSAKSEAELLDAVREYLQAIEIAPWVAGYYYDLCVILEKAGRPAEATRACKLYLIAAPAAPDAGDVRKRVAGLEYALERLRNNVTQRHDCANMSDIYGTGDKVALIGDTKVSVKLISSLYAGVWRNQLLMANMATYAVQRYELTPIDKTFQLEDRVQGMPWFRLTVARDGRITFGGSGSAQAEIVTSISELHQLRNTQMNNCLIATKNGKFFVLLSQGGGLRPNDGASVNGGLAFESNCSGNLLGEKPGWFPVAFVPHPETPGVTRDQASWAAQGFYPASADACQASSNDGLGWLAQ